MATANLSFWLKWVANWKAGGINTAIVCPGSRSSPLVQALITTGWNLHSCVDERSAGYQALGMAQALARPVVVVTTSGTAAANLAPAMAEAFFSRIPLVAWTADRPPEWIGQEDNQAIHQPGLFGHHSIGDWNLPLVDEDSARRWHAERCAREARKALRQTPTGPVHLNIPFREPLYASPSTRENHPVGSWASEAHPHHDSIDFSQFKRTLLLHGQAHFGNSITMPANGIGEVLSRHPLRLAAEAWLPELVANPELRPDLIVTSGGAFVSKSLRGDLRKWSFTHAHLGPSSAEVFCRPVEAISPETIAGFDLSIWDSILDNARLKLQKTWEADVSLEFAAVRHLVESLPAGSHVHLGNSLTIRIASLLPSIPVGVRFWCNRGTSGIDGSLSTAVGHALASPDRQHIAIIGDQSFFYDRNALWRDALPSNLRVVVLNNHEGAIFRALDGPTDWQDHLRFWTTPHKRTAEFTARDHGLHYHSAQSLAELEGVWQSLRNESGCGLLEIFTDAAETAADFRRILSSLRESETV